MVEVDFVQTEDKRKYRVILNGEVFEKTYAQPRFERDGDAAHFQADVWDSDGVAILLKETFCDLSHQFAQLSLQLPSDGLIAYKVDLVFDPPNIEIETAPYCVCRVVPDSSNWTLPYSIREFVSKFGQLAEQDLPPELEWNALAPIVSLTLGFVPASWDMPVTKELERWFEGLRCIVRRAEDELVQEAQGDVLAAIFSFPQEVRSACEQYLAYFAQFLKDLGLDVQTDLQQRAGETLFTVIPTSGPEALGKIKEALDTYLSLPYSPAFQHESAQSRELAVLQLQAEVTNLQHKVAQARVWLQLQGEKIEQLELENFGYRQQVERFQWAALPSGDAEKPIGDDEPLLWGAVTVTALEIKQLGLKINTPHLIRQLRRRRRGE